LAKPTEGVRTSYCSRVASLLINLVVRQGLTDVEFESRVEQILFNYEGHRVPQVTFRIFGEDDFCLKKEWLSNEKAHHNIRYNTLQEIP
jgi:hypothetical protein